MESQYWRIEKTEGKRRVIFPTWENLYFSPSQFLYQQTDSKREIVMAGRGYGKDHQALFKKLRYGYETYFKKKHDPSLRGAGLVYHLMIFAGEEDNYIDNINKLKEMIPRVPGIGAGGKANYKFNVKDQRFELFGDTQFWISCVSLFGSAGGKRGPGADDALITEPQELTKDKVMSVVMPMIMRPGFDGRISMVGTGNNGWFDTAFEQAKGGDPRDYFGNFTAYGGSTFDNPRLTWAQAKQVAREYNDNPERFLRERMGLPNIIVRDNVTPDCPFHQGLIESCLTTERINLQGPPLIVLDLMYGGNDKLCAGFWNKERNALWRIEFHTKDSLKVDIKNPYPALSAYIIELAKRHPGCTIAYDAQGQFGGSLSAHVPRHIRLVPMRRSREQKNAMVENLIERMGTHDAMGKSIGIRIPSPDSTWLDVNQRMNFRKLLTDLMHYRKLTKQRPDGTMSYYYTKGEGYEDDGPDMVTWTTSQLHPMNRGQAKPLRAGAFNRALLLG